MSRARRIDRRQPCCALWCRDAEKTPMQPDDQLAEWLVQWEEARVVNKPPPAVDQLPAELRSRARDGLQLLRGFARMAHGLSAAGPAPPGDAPQPPRARNA